MTAKDFLLKKAENNPLIKGLDTNISQQELLIEFAKLHVKAALEAASTVEITEITDYESGREFYYQNYGGILNAYPLENIK